MPKKPRGLISRAEIKKMADRSAKKAVKKHNVDPKAHANMK